MIFLPFEPTVARLGDDPHLEPLVVRAGREWSLLTGRPRHRGTHSADDAEWPHPTEAGRRLLDDPAMAPLAARADREWQQHLTQPHVQHLVDGSQS